MKKLVGRRPAQDQRGRLGRVDVRRHQRHVVGLERPIGGIRTEDRHIGHAVADVKASHAGAELIDFPDDVIAHHEGWPATYPWVDMTPDRHVGVFHAGSERADPHLAPAGRR
jgi:hypothetical protein